MAEALRQSYDNPPRGDRAAGRLDANPISADRLAEEAQQRQEAIDAARRNLNRHRQPQTPTERRTAANDNHGGTGQHGHHGFFHKAKGMAGGFFSSFFIDYLWKSVIVNTAKGGFGGLKKASPKKAHDKGHDDHGHKKAHAKDNHKGDHSHH